MQIRIDITLKGIPPGGTKEQTYTVKPWILDKPVTDWPRYVKSVTTFVVSDVLTMLRGGLDQFMNLKDPVTEKKVPDKPKKAPAARSAKKSKADARTGHQ